VLHQRGMRVQHLLAAGLGPRVAAADDVRNLLLSPAAGRDPAALLDTRPLADQLLALLQDSPAFHGLSAKFALQLDGGEALAMLDHPHDLWLSALPGGSQLAFGLAGCPRDPALGVVEVGQAPQLVQAVLELFLQLAGEHSRMRQLLAELPVADFLARLPVPLDLDVPLPARPETAVVPLGMHPQAQAGLAMLLAGAPLGRLEAVQLWALADLAEAEGSGELRLTPWQGVLLPDIPVARQAAVMAALGEIGLLLDVREPLSQLLACTGSAACTKGLADTKADALHLAELLNACRVQPQMHLSGCPRSCAAAHTAPFTLLAQPGGRYQLYQRTAGVAGFGRLLAPSLSIEEAGAWFAAHHESGTSA
jgi:precorrin-3B synthase